MAALSTVAEYVTAARTLLSDTVEPFRYSTADLVLGLSIALLEARRLRPDLFIGRYDDIPSFTVSDATAVDFDEQYRMALVYYIIGHAQLRDAEDTQDARAAAFLNKFTSQLTVLG
jgi:hypothetical protein